MRSAYLALIALSSLTFSAENGFASQIIIELTGVFDEPDFTYTLAEPGDTWSAQMTLDILTPDTNSADWVGWYYTAASFSAMYFAAL